MANDNAGAKPQFWKLFGYSFKAFFGNLKAFGPLFLIFWVVNILLNMLGMELGVADYSIYGIDGFDPMGFSWLNWSIFMGLALLVGTALGLAMIKIALGVYKGKKVELMESLSFGIKNVFAAIWIHIRKTWYIMKWPLFIIIVVTLLGSIFTAIMAGSVANAESLEAVSEIAEVSAELELTAEEIEAMEELAELFESPDAQAAAAVVGMGALFAFIMVFTFLVFIIFGVWRGTQLYFAFFMLVDKGKKGWAALQGSIDIVKGNFWRVFFYLFFYILLMILIFVVPFIALYLLASQGLNVVLMLALQGFISLLMGFIFINFATALYSKLSK